MDKNNLSINTMYYIQRKGDNDNVLYDSLTKNDLSSYKRYEGWIVGLPSYISVEFIKSSKDKYTKQAVMLKQYRERHDYYKSLIPKDSTYIKSAISNEKENHQPYDEEFIPLKTEENEKIVIETEDLIIDEKHKEYLNKTREFNEKLEKDPKNVKLWFDYIGFQDINYDVNIKKTSVKNSINEKKISIFEKALKEIPDDESLIKEYMKCCQISWDSIKVLSKWDQILKQHPRSCGLWIEYLNYRQSDFSSFTVNSCIEEYGKCISVLSREKEYVVDLGLSKTIENTLIYCFVRLCDLLSKSGYYEKAISLYQAMIEITFFCPSILKNQSFKVKIQELEVFWENEYPRFGEEKSKGWNNVYLNEEEGEEEETYEDEKIPNIKTENQYEKWGLIELFMEYNHTFPLRPLKQGINEDNIDDPFRVVVFDDIRPFLFEINIPELKPLLFIYFLSLFNIHLIPNISTKESILGKDQFLQTISIPSFSSQLKTKMIIDRKIDQELFQTYPLIDNITPTQQDSSIENKLNIFPLKNFPLLPDTIYSNGSWFGLITKEDSQVINDKFDIIIRNILNQITDNINISLNSKSFLLWYIASHSYKSSKKIAKHLLKIDSSNIKLWCTFAQIELSFNHINEARKIYKNIIKMKYSLGNIDKYDYYFLICQYSEMEMNQGNHDLALYILIESLNSNSTYSKLDDNKIVISPLQILKSRTDYQNEYNELISNINNSKKYSNNYQYMYLFFCFGLFEYLTQGFEDMCHYYDTLLNNIPKDMDYLNESILMFYSKVQYNHRISHENFIRNHDKEENNKKFDTLAYKPSVFREFLESTIDNYGFQDNTAFWELYLWNENRMKIDNRLNNFLDLQLKKNPSIFLYLIGIFSELKRYKKGNIHLIKDHIERALQFSRHSINLWIIYIMIELDNNNIEHAKSLFFQSIRECPWSKELYMMPFKLSKSFLHSFSDEELDEIMNTMEEKELRIRNML
ncbi:hypothetical protein BCR36DRAFT_588024 [Piromyces finnis]|uniref:DUF1740-domain-containing protein n=1 Tax=Piromyces finnis TaxID=1754191 RepID=A0A1Y1UVG0_9FUNG|nr:hypothetical protein BCR36DRAFT_588024 [Piromyces finnis]|eukprot:ORX41457.1 hypothetical protein BCR36DRAFT_588024 [Piromyces finnis]